MICRILFARVKKNINIELNTDLHANELLARLVGAGGGHSTHHGSIPIGSNLVSHLLGARVREFEIALGSSFRVEFDNPVSIPHLR
jgi:hypothetical protein